MLLIGTPVYICAAAATPVAVAPIAKGLDPGADLVLLLVGPATNATTMIVIARLLGKRILVAHLIGVTGCAVALGAALSGLYRLLGMDLSRVAADVVERGLSPVAVVTAVILLFFLSRSAIRLQLLGQWGQRLRRLGAPLGVDPFAPAIQVAFLMVMGLAYLSTAFSVIGPGEVGWVLRFGRVVRTVSEPRLLMHFPLPFDRVKHLRPQAVRRVELGLAQQPGDMLEKIPWAADRGMTPDGLQWMSMRQDLAAEAEVITGDENIISIQYAVHFDTRDPYVYQYRFANPEEVVRALAAWVLRQAVARHAATDILVAQRVALERESLDLLQDELDTIGMGVRIIAVTLQDVHAAPPVHAAFRDVASALEDKARKTQQAQGYRSETLTLARAEAFRLMQDAASYQSDVSNTARGQASAFLSRLEAYRTHPALRGYGCILKLSRQHYPRRE